LGEVKRRKNRWTGEGTLSDRTDKTLKTRWDNKEFHKALEGTQRK